MSEPYPQPDPDAVLRRPPPEERTRIRDIPEVQNLRIALIDNGFGELVRVADAHLEIDTAGMKQAATEVYGLSKERILDKGRVSVAVEDIATHTHDRMLESVGGEWEGDSYEAFKRYSEKLRNATDREAERLRVIGDGLYIVADAIEDGQEDLELTLLGAAGIMTTAKNLFKLGPSLVTIVIGAAEAMLSTIEKLQQEAKVAAENAEAQTEARIEISRPKAMTEGPRQALREYTYPNDPGAWQIDED